jgi:D-citramalate synthase
VHVTVNGLGERTGNAPLDEVVVAVKDMLGITSSVREEELVTVSKMVEAFSGRRLAHNKPVCGWAVFTQTAGIHADGDKKGNLYVTRLTPERFRRTRTYALGKHSGKASLDMNLAKLGVELSNDQKKLVLQRVIELGDQKKSITIDDLPFIISDVLSSPENQVFKVVDYLIKTTMSHTPQASIKISYKGKEYEAKARGDGGYDAFMKALRLIAKRIGVPIPRLLDYEVHIPPGGRTDALVETKITWENELVTRGVDSDQLKAAVIATENMLNLLVRRKKRK